MVDLYEKYVKIFNPVNDCRLYLSLKRRNLGDLDTFLRSFLSIYELGYGFMLYPKGRTFNFLG